MRSNNYIAIKQNFVKHVGQVLAFKPINKTYQLQLLVKF